MCPVTIFSSNICIQIVVHICKKFHLKKILEMVVNWLKHDWENRRVHAPNLLQMVRLGLVPKQSISSLVGPDILEIPECKVLFQEFLKEPQSADSVVDLAQKPSHYHASRSTIMVSLKFLQNHTEIRLNKIFKKKNNNNNNSKTKFVSSTYMLQWRS